VAYRRLTAGTSARRGISGLRVPSLGRGRTVRGIAVLVLGTALVLPQAGVASAKDTQRLVRVSSGDPFAACTIGATPDSVLYPGAEVEPSVADNRYFPGEVVGAWQQDRWSDGGSRGIVAGYSRNGGQTFARSQWPVSRCVQGGLDYERASDPWVSIGPEGVVYGSALSFDATTPRNAVVATTSYDGGRTWRNTTPVIADTEARFFNDKNSVTADPVRPGTAYQLWDRLEFSPDGTRFVTGPAWTSVTHDFGRTWGAPHIVVRTAPFEQTIGNVLVVDPRTHTLYDFYTAIQYTDGTTTGVQFVRFEVVRSRDGGRSWSAPSVIAPDTSVPDVDPNDPSKVLRTGAGLPEPAVDPRTGTLYVVYEGTDFTAGAYNQVQLVRSTDGGRTWSAPIRVNGDPSVPAFTPKVAVTKDGDVGVSYYDLRSLTPGNTTTLPTDTWLTVSPPGGRSFIRERRLAPTFDHLQAPVAGGYFLGDYQGLTASRDRFRALFVTTNTGQPANRTDVWFAQVRSIDPWRSVSPAGSRPQAGASTARPTAKLPLRMRH
jgi:hypothetical protein